MTTVQRIYNDLLEFFGDDRILENDKEFKAWLERIRRNCRRVDELAFKLKEIETASKDAISKASVCEILSDLFPMDSFEKVVLVEDLSEAYERITALPPVYPKVKSDVLDKIRAEIEDWQTDIHDNEYDAKEHDFVFERIFEIIDKYRGEQTDAGSN